MTTQDQPAADAGFTLIEVLAVLLMTGVLLSGATMLTGQWMRSWDRGARVLQDADTVAVALDRLRADVGAALYLSARDGAAQSAFVGGATEIRFVQESRDRQAPPGLEIVAYKAAESGYGLSRSRAAYTSDTRLSAAALQAETVVLTKPWRVNFSFIDQDGGEQADWRRLSLPAAVRVAVLADGASAGPGLGVSIPIRAQLPFICRNEKSFARCLEIADGRAKPSGPNDDPDDAAPQSRAQRLEAVR